MKARSGMHHAALWALAGLLLAAPPASAHIQVRPAEAAPDDPVLFEVLVPGESGESTTEVELAVPPGVLPFSFSESPGWRRTTTKADDGSVGSIVWRGRLAPDGFARFGFLASTPSDEGPIAWKAIQTYADGSKVRWIGAPDSGEPAAVTQITSTAPRQNAGGEAAGGGAGEAPAAEAAPPAPAPEPSGGAIPLALSIAALATAVAALLMARRRQTG